MRDEAEAVAVEAEDDAAPMVPEEFAVRDERSAEWLVRKVVEAEAHIRRVKEQADREVRRTQREHDFLLLRYGRQLEDWAKAELSKHKGRRKSLNLLSGTVGFRAVGAKLTVDDETQTLLWAKRHCKGAIVTVERLSKSGLNQHFADTGEVPAGAHVEPATESFYIK